MAGCFVVQPLTVHLKGFMKAQKNHAKISSKLLRKRSEGCSGCKDNLKAQKGPRVFEKWGQLGAKLESQILLLCQKAVVRRPPRAPEWFLFLAFKR